MPCGKGPTQPRPTSKPCTPPTSPLAALYARFSESTGVHGDIVKDSHSWGPASAPRARKAVAGPARWVEDQLAQAPAPTRLRPDPRVKSKVSAFFALVTTRTRRKSSQNPGLTIDQSCRVSSAETRALGGQVSSNRAANFTPGVESSVTQVAASQSAHEHTALPSDPAAGLDRQASQSQPSSSNQLDSSLLTRHTLSTSRTSVDVEYPLRSI